ncbi:EF-hand domain-containing protein [Maricaulis sp.]|uniref:type II toxin-antitoxin system RelB/DinJ family antitoxin n=1 Tax=Maricaulis sp. TaxID=1486257 RepID=UPI0025BD2918|nr:EF-hand domain-containing protein [Maricaulis sp.]
MKRREKQSEFLEIRIGHQTKQDFMQACQSQGVTASEVLRAYVETYSGSRRPRRVLPSLNFKEYAMPASFLALISVVAAATGLQTTSPADADRNDPEASFASVDRDGSQDFDLAELFEEAGLTADGHLGPELRAEVTGSVQTALAELGMDAQQGVASPDYLARVIANAEQTAAQSVTAVFHMIDTNGDGRVTRDEFMNYRVE